MSIAFRAAPASIDDVFGDVTTACYLTDGEGLYRTLGRTADIDERLVCVEDCVTLQVLLVPLDTVLGLAPVARAETD
jgi:hypothetical protein